MVGHSDFGGNTGGSQIQKTVWLQVNKDNLAAKYTTCPLCYGDSFRV